MAELGTAYINIVPSTQGISGAISGALNSEASSAGQSAGKSAGNSFGSSFGQTMKTAGKVVAGATAAVATAAAAGTAAIVNGAKDVAAYGDNVDKMSQKIGFSASSYQQWAYVMERAGTNVDNLQTGMKTLSAQAQANSEDFQALGISQEEVATLSKEDLFGRVIEGLSSMEDGTERTALATSLLGRAGSDLGPLLNEGTDAIMEQMQMAEDYGMVMSDEMVAASANFTDSMTTLTGTLTGVKNNMIGQFLPACTSVTDGLAKVFSGDMSGMEDINAGISEFVDQVDTLLPQVLEIGGGIIAALADAIIQHLPDLMQTGTQIILKLIQSIVSNLPQLITTGISVVLTLITGITEALPDLIPAIVEVIPTVINTLIENLPLLIEAGWQLTIALLTGLISAIPDLVAAIPDMVMTLVNTFVENGPQMLEAGAELISQLWEAIKAAWEQLKKDFGPLIESLKASIVNKWNAIKTATTNAWNAVKTTIMNIWNNIKTTISNTITSIQLTITTIWNSISTSVSTAVNNIWTSITTAFTGAWGSVTTIFNGIWTSISTALTGAWTTVSTTVASIWTSISTAFNGAWTTVSTVFSNIYNTIYDKIWGAYNAVASAIEWIKSLFNFSWSLPYIPLPHIKFDKYVTYPLIGTIPDPFSLRVEWYKKAYSDPILFNSPTILGTADGYKGFGDGAGGEIVIGQSMMMDMISSAVAAGAGNGITINVYPSAGMDEKTLADRVAERLSAAVDRRKAAFA